VAFIFLPILAGLLLSIATPAVRTGIDEDDNQRVLVQLGNSTRKSRISQVRCAE
jgi:hypothetical protein